MPDLWIVFTTGLLTGGISCMAVQGGLLATTLAARKVEDQAQTGDQAKAIGIFLGAKLATHVLLGLLLGGIGGVIALTPAMRAWFQGAAAGYMLLVGMAMLEVHPVFRRFLIQTPRWAGKLIRQQSKSGSWFAPAILGFLTILIPCGATQAMMVLAIGSGNPGYGAMILGAFVLGTSPLFFLLGMAITKLGEWMKESFRKTAAWTVVGMALWSLNGALVVGGSTITAQKALAAVKCTISYCTETEQTLKPQTPVSEVTINFTSEGYVTDNNTIKAGQPVTLHLVNTNGTGCIQAFVMPAEKIQKVVRVGQREDVEFTAPEKPGRLSFSCGMGMYTGELKVVE